MNLSKYIQLNITSAIGGCLIKFHGIHFVGRNDCDKGSAFAQLKKSVEYYLEKNFPRIEAHHHIHDNVRNPITGSFWGEGKHSNPCHSFNNIREGDDNRFGSRLYQWIEWNWRIDSDRSDSEIDIPYKKVKFAGVEFSERSLIKIHEKIELLFEQCINHETHAKDKLPLPVHPDQFLQWRENTHFIEGEISSEHYRDAWREWASEGIDEDPIEPYSQATGFSD